MQEKSAVMQLQAEKTVWLSVDTEAETSGGVGTDSRETGACPLCSCRQLFSKPGTVERLADRRDE